MGNLTTYGHEPRAVLSVERNLRERRPGVYETSTTLPAAGSYDLALFLDQPRFTSCFDLAIAPDPALHSAEKPRVKIESHVPSSVVRGQPAHLAFRIRPETQIADLVILVVGAGWQHRQLAQPQENGFYAADFNIPVTGIYRVLVTAPSLRYRSLSTAP